MNHKKAVSGNEQMSGIRKTAGFSLIVGSLLQLTRMIPIAMSDGIKMLENFPPHNLEDTLLAAQASGWHLSHMMVFVASPLLVTGFYGVYKLTLGKPASSIGLLGLIGLSIGIMLYTIGACIDGLTLAEVAKRTVEANGAEQETLGIAATVIHELAISFGGPAFAFLLISSGFLGLSLKQVGGFSLFSWIAMLIGALSSLGYLTGWLDIMVTDSFMLTGGLTMLMFFFYLALGIKLFRSPELQ